ncbi:hypothetical protein EDB84DRAFT_1577837 [Lactarius hengduanensis]|nr:hypothetical protein EDB84DRAFT_1577837 [Lactarius hengduanensis]
MYYDNDDNDPYAPRIGPAAMPSPRSKFAPYYSGCTDSFEDFLEEYEGLAHDCALTDPQRVDVLIRYVAPSLRDFWRSLNGYRSHDWPLFQQSLVTIFGNPIPQAPDHETEAAQQFICFGIPLVHAGHMSEEERDTAFWYGFHPEDRKVIQPRLLGKNPFQPPDIPFHFEDVFVCARAAFAYDGSSFWSHAKQFEPPSIRCEHPYSDLPHSLISPSESPYTQAPSVTVDQPETAPMLSTTLRPSASFPTPDLQLPSSSSPSVLESQHGLVHSVTVDQPEPAYTLSATLPPSDSPPSHTSTLVLSATDNDLIPAPTFSIPSSTFFPSASEDQLEPEPAPTFPISTSTLRPSAFSPSPTHTHSLAHVIADGNPEIPSTSSPTPAPFTMPISSDFEYLPLVTLDQPEHASLSAITPTSPSLPSPSLTLEFTDDVRELLALPLTPLSTSLARSEDSTSLSSPTKPPPSETLTSMPAHSLPSLRPSPVLATPASSYHPESSLLSLGETIPFLSASLEVPPIAPISPHSTPPQRPPGSKTVDSDSFLLEITPSLASSVPQQSQELSLVYEAASAFAPRPSLLHSSPLLLSSGPSSVRFNFAFVFITTEVLVSTLFDILATTFTLAHKYWSKQEDFGNSQISTLNTSSRDVFAQQLRLGQLTPRAPRLRKSKTHNDFFVTHVAIYSHSSRQSHRFDPGGGAFVLEPAHEDSATFDEEDVQ